jgi:hypothetical protein
MRRPGEVIFWVVAVAAGVLIVLAAGAWLAARL